MTSEQQLLERITITPGLMSAKPTIRGMRFPVSDILELLASGLSEKEIIEQHPILEPADIQASLFYASLKINKVVSWTLGVDNLFNVHPAVALIKGSVSPTSGSSSFGDSESGGPYEAVQMGFNGMRLFTKLTFHF